MSPIARTFLNVLKFDLSDRQALVRMLPWAAFLLFGLVAELLLYEQKNRQESIARQNIISHAGEIRATIESELNASIHLTSGLVAFIQTKRGRYEIDEMAAWLGNLQKQKASIRNITLAPDNRVQMVIPVAGNEGVSGRYFPDIKDQWPEIERLIESKKPRLVGPFELRQGGLGFAYRIPVFFDDGGYWGLVNTIFNVDKIFQFAHARSTEMGIDFAILDLEKGAKGKIIYGKNDLKADADSALSVTIPGRELGIYVREKEREKFFAFTQVQRLIAWVIAAFLALLIARTLKFYRRQERADTALNESQQRFTQAFNTAPQGMGLLDDKGRWISVNPMLCDILGYEELSLLQAPLLSFSEELTMRSLHDRWRAQKRDGLHSLQFELALRHFSGGTVNCLLSLAFVETPETSSSIDSSNTNSRYWIFQIIDITRRIAAEKKLQDSAEYAQTIFENVADGIVSTTLDGDVCSINPAAIAIWKFPKIVFFRSNFFTLLHSKENATLAAEIRGFIDGVQSKAASISDESGDVQYEKEILRFVGQSLTVDQFGANIYIAFTITTTEQKGRTELIIVVRDISEQKRLETMQSEFVSVVSHELRTPLTSIIGSLKLIDAGVLGSVPEGLKKMLRIALQNGQQLALIINDILDMDKLAAGKMEFSIKEQAIMPLIEQALESNQGYAKTHQVQFIICNSLPNCVVMVDHLRLQQIMSNLLSNAAKFSRENGQVHIHLIETENRLRIAVQDFGDGIASQYHDRIFKKFSQVDGSDTRKKGGTGLGLSICKEMVERMDGELAFISAEGEGSTFYFTVPIAAKKISH